MSNDLTSTEIKNLGNNYNDCSGSKTIDGKEVYSNNISKPIKPIIQSLYLKGMIDLIKNPFFGFVGVFTEEGLETAKMWKTMNDL